MKKPLKRIKEMQPYSKDHHHGLLLGWKLRTGLRKGVAVGRLQAYAHWFYTNHLVPHFSLEEKYLFPILGEENELVKRALAEHRQMHLMMQGPGNEDSLTQFADLLESHIRFEERELFGEIQSVATQAQLGLIKEVHDDGKFTEHSDEFWK
jgi:hemerythrin-like domain-containing protein